MSVYVTVDNPHQDGERYRRFRRERFTVVMRFFKDAGGFGPLHKPKWHVHVFLGMTPIGYGTASDPRFAVHEAIRAARRVLMWPQRDGLWFRP